MSTSVATRDEPLANFHPPRLPYHPALEQRFGVDRSVWKALVEAVFPAAKSVDSIVMALSYCRARNLDPFKRPVHIVPMWDSKKRAYVETVWPGIAEVRTTAFRTGQYAGCDEAEFGPDIEQTFAGTVRDEDRSVTARFPEWCRMTVYRMIGGQRVPFVGPKVYWIESYAKIGASDIPNDMWAKRPRGQLEKCAEAGALRKAFPEEVGNMLTAEEMEGQRLVADHVAPTVDAPSAAPAGRQKAVVVQGSHRPLPPVVGEDVFAPSPYEAGRQARRDGIGFRSAPALDADDLSRWRQGWQDEDRETHAGAPAHDPDTGEIVEGEAVEASEPAAADAPFNPDDWLRDVEAALSGAKTHKQLLDAWRIVAESRKTDAFPPDWARAERIFATHEERIGA